ncbi:MAG: hypothetical protein DRP79_01555 [Planctomycetota bacterium]|nr:MAG: hypothetical protein DRP79_01555 [Planctomycetota bacterium]
MDQSKNPPINPPGITPNYPPQYPPGYSLQYPPPGPRYYGVKGWLLFFCLVLTVVGPLLTVVTFSYAVSEIIEYFDTFPGLLNMLIIDCVLSVGLMSFSVYAGIALWRIKPNAVKIAKSYLVCYLIYAFIAAGLPFAAGLPEEANMVILGESVKDLFRSFIFFVIWFSYLSKSKRVRDTYGYPPVTTGY